MKRRKGQIHICRQPTETSCGPTCLQAVYDYYGYHLPLDEMLKEVLMLQSGGTLAVNLGLHALKHGFEATIYTYNLQVFDPTWFTPTPLSSEELIRKLQAQIRAKSHRRIREACKAYIQYLKQGGILKMEDLSSELILRHLRKKRPLLTGLSSTYLYQSAREYVYQGRQRTDDIRGQAEGHFVIVEKYDLRRRLVQIADPYGQNPFSPTLRYRIPIGRLVTALLLGVLTYDSNFLVIAPKRH